MYDSFFEEVRYSIYLREGSRRAPKRGFPG